jgi:AraC-like DNA-binding protein
LGGGILQENIKGLNCGKIEEISKDILFIPHSEREKGGMWLCQIYDGVMVWVNRCKTFSVPTVSHGDHYHYLKINYAAKGNCEVKVRDNKFIYVNEGLLSVDTNEAQEQFVFPKGFYWGLEVMVNLDEVKETPIDLFEDCGISFSDIQDSLQKTNGTFLGQPQTDWKALAEHIMKRMQEGSVCKEELRLAILNLLYPYISGNIVPIEHISYLSRGQKEIVLEVAERMRNNLDKKYTIEELAKGYGISASAMKKYFGQVFNMPISEYVRKERLGKAAKLLKTTDKSVQDIAACCGYQHQGKFGVVFKEMYQMSPLEYRRMSRTKGGVEIL